VVAGTVDLLIGSQTTNSVPDAYQLILEAQQHGPSEECGPSPGSRHGRRNGDSRDGGDEHSRAFRGPRSGRRAWFAAPEWQQITEEHGGAVGKAFDGDPQLAAFAREFADALADSGVLPSHPPADVSSAAVMAAVDAAVQRASRAGQGRPAPEHSLAADDSERLSYLTVRGLAVHTGTFPSLKPLFDAYEQAGSRARDGCPPPTGPPATSTTRTAGC